ncbi:diguanylate cyclase [candidate division CSSED10-310 bacterium]|uniref:Diguanylate cyclase n=1 Tax=candidate division CSSED10-310 bacterium TaxID=2855610 RepID=A0ABV6Z185_UNCC1
MLDPNIYEQKKQLILIVDDAPINLKMLSSILRTEGYEIALATSGREALSLIDEISPDLILLDITMPGMDGYEVCKILKDSFETKDIPLIFLTAKKDTEDVVKGFELGAVDYITKPFNSAELLSRVNTHLEVRKLNSLIINYYDRQLKNEIELRKKIETEKKDLYQEIEEKNKLLKAQAYNDYFTNLDSFKAIIEKLSAEIASAKRFNYPLTIALFNIDHLKEINYEFGHMYGDVIISEVASLIKKEMHDRAMIGRHNGDEYLVIFPQLTLEEGRKKAENIRKKITELQLEDEKLHVSISVGICTLQDENCANLIRKADELLSQAKNKGRDRIEG